jgi:hypothetical protein
MTPTFLGAILAGLFAAEPKVDTPRRPHPFAPSLPELTEAEEDKIDRVIDRFILQDTGKLRGAEGLAALREFERLGPEAIPALIRGLNRAAKIQHSCPATVITKKLNRMLLASLDTELLQFARDEVGSGVGRSRHQALLQDLRVTCMLHRNALLRAGVTPPRPLFRMTVAELSTAMEKESATPRLKLLLTEVERRRGPEAIAALARAAGNRDEDVRQTARELLDKHLYRQSVDTVKEKLTDAHPEVRRAAIRLAVARMPALTGYVVDLLNDPEAEVRLAAHQALQALAMGKDFGPTPGADAAAREEAVKKWRSWWEAQQKDR